MGMALMKERAKEYVNGKAADSEARCELSAHQSAETSHTHVSAAL
jgi:hypothetical protein